MKKLCFALILFLICTETEAQGVLYNFNIAWKNLTLSIENKNKYVIGLLLNAYASDSSKAFAAEAAAIQFHDYVSTFDRPDSLSAQKTYELFKACMPGYELATTLIQKDTYTDEERQKIQFNLNNLQNQIDTASKKYNNLCLQYDRKNILFPEQ